MAAIPWWDSELESNYLQWQLLPAAMLATMLATMLTAIPMTAMPMATMYTVIT